MDITAIANQQAGTVTLETDVCIAGEGPAGMIMGLFLAKQGMDVIVLEKKENFHPEFQQEQSKTSFMQLMCELDKMGNMDKNIKPAMQELLLFIEEEKVQQLLMRPLYTESVRMNRMVVMALYKQAESYPNLTLFSDASVKSVLYENDQVAGVFAETSLSEQYFIHSKITIGIDEQQIEKMEKEKLAGSGHLLITEAEQASWSDAM